MIPDISFAIVARDEPPSLLEATVLGILQTSAGYKREIVIVDDGSHVPVSLDLPEVRVVRNPEPIGTAQSRRLGLSMTGGDVLVSMDAHMSFVPDWLERMLAHVDSGALLCASWWDYELTRPLCWGADFLWCSERNYASGQSPGLTFRHRTSHPGEAAVEAQFFMQDPNGINVELNFPAEETKPEDIEALAKQTREKFLQVPTNA